MNDYQTADDMALFPTTLRADELYRAVAVPSELELEVHRRLGVPARTARIGEWFALTFRDGSQITVRIIGTRRTFSGLRALGCDRGFEGGPRDPFAAEALVLVNAIKNWEEAERPPLRFVAACPTGLPTDIGYFATLVEARDNVSPFVEVRQAEPGNDPPTSL